MRMGFDIVWLGNSITRIMKIGVTILAVEQGVNGLMDWSGVVTEARLKLLAFSYTILRWSCLFYRTLL